jgi:hypothetical protein
VKDARGRQTSLNPTDRQLPLGEERPDPPRPFLHEDRFSRMRRCVLDEGKETAGGLRDALMGSDKAQRWRGVG